MGKISTFNQKNPYFINKGCAVYKQDLTFSIQKVD